MTESDGGRCVAVLLAAGTGSRFEDGYKLLADVNGRPVVAAAAETLLTSTVDDVVAVVGHRADEVEATLSAVGVDAVFNPHFGHGQSTSVRVGVDAARERNADAALFALGDMPCVDAATVDELCDRYRSTDASLVAPSYDGARGNPVLFDRRYFDALADVSGDTGGKVIIRREPVSAVETDDSGVRLDIDTTDDLAHVRQSCEGGSGRE